MRAQQVLRNRFQFSLGALGIAIAFFALWLGREAHLIRERDRLVQSIEFLRAFEPTPGQKGIGHIPWHWNYLGAKPIEYMAIRLPSGRYNARDVERVGAIYPELDVSLSTSDSGIRPLESLLLVR